MPEQGSPHECPVAQQESHPTDHGTWQRGQDGQAPLKAQSGALRPGVGGTDQVPAISDPTENFLTSYSVSNTHPHTQPAGVGLQVPAGPA